MKWGDVVGVGAAVLIVLALNNAASQPGAMTPLSELPSDNFWVRMNQTESGGDLLVSVGIVAAAAWLVFRTKLGRGDALPGCLNDLVVLALGIGGIYLLYLI